VRPPDAARSALGEWIDRLRTEVGDGFPDKLTPSGRSWPSTARTAGRAPSAAHRCSAPVQRSHSGEDDWPRTPEGPEERRG
jgi:hypothetical protein